MADQQPGVSIGAALQDRMSKRGLNFKNTKGKLAISRTLNISIPHFDALLKDKADVDDAMTAKLGELLGTGADFWTELQKQRGPVRPYSAQVEDVTPTAGPEPVGQTTAPVIPAPASMQEVKPLSLAEDPENWEHAEYAWDLLRHDRYVEIEPNFLMAAVDESSDDDPLAKDLLRKLMIFYVTFSPDGHATIWVGKHVTFQRTYRTGRWKMQRVQPLYRDDRLSMQIRDKVQLIWYWRYCDDEAHELEERNAPKTEQIVDFAPQVKSIEPQPTLVTLPSAADLAQATTDDLKKLLWSCSNVLRSREQSDQEYEYEYSDVSYRPDQGEEKPTVEVIGCKDGKVMKRVVALKREGGSDKRQKFGGTVKAKNGDVFDECCIPISGHMEWHVETFADQELHGLRIQRYVRGLREEFMPEAKEFLREYGENTDSEYFANQIRHVKAYIAWATGGVDVEPPHMERAFPYSIYYSYPNLNKGGRPVELFHATQQNGTVVYNPVNLRQIPEKWKHANQFGNNVVVHGFNGDGFKLINGSESVSYYFPFEGRLHVDSGSITETRFLRYVDGYRKEILPEIQKERDDHFHTILEPSVKFDTTRRIEYQRTLRRLDKFIAWIKGEI
jgi:plasmid maintenance system antidote protein VapI